MHGSIEDRQGQIELAYRAAFARGGVRFVPAARTLQGPLREVAVEPRVMQLLVALADAEGEVVSRDLLVDRCWGNVTVGEDSLNRAVAGARKALRAVDGALAGIETIPKIGYRMPVAEPAAGGAMGAGTAEGAASPPPAEGSSATGSGRAQSRRSLLLGAAALAGGGVAGWALLRRDATPGPADLLIEQGNQAMRLALPEADRQGLGFFAEATRVAPGDARAWGLLALARQTAAQYAAPDELRAAVAAVEAAADRALALEPEQPDALAARALLVPHFGNWRTADRDLRAVLRVAPGHLPTLDGLAYLLAGAGMLRAHYPLRLKTVEEDPFHCGYNFRSIYSHWMNGELAAADRAGERGLELWPRHFATWSARSGLFGFTGRAERALAMLDDSATRPALPPVLLESQRATYRALASGAEADRRAARAIVLKAVQTAGPYLAVNGALMLAVLAEPDLALDVSEAYLLERGPITTDTRWKPGQVLHNDVRRRMTNYLFLPVMAEVRKSPRFAPMMADVGLADYWRQTGQTPDHLPS